MDSLDKGQDLCCRRHPYQRGDAFRAHDQAAGNHFSACCHCFMLQELFCAEPALFLEELFDQAHPDLRCRRIGHADASLCPWYPQVEQIDLWLIVFVLLWAVYSGDHIHRPECQFGYPRISCCGGDALVLARDSWCGGFCVDPCLRGLHIFDHEHECSDERLWLSLCRLRLPGVHPSRRAESGGFRQGCQRRIPRQNKTSKRADR